MDSAVIFAGGKSSRMGQDKALLPFGSHSSMAALQYQKLQKLFRRVYLSSKEEKFGFDAPLLKDLYPQSSPMVALASVLEQTEAEALFVLSVDMPLITASEIRTLCETYESATPKPDILIAQSPKGIEPLCGIYHRSILPQVKALLAEDQHRMRALMDHVSTQTVIFSDSSSFANINTPEEYQAAIRP
jgi:molybdopterin-guanine dinucleotide biosynthesis protein A